MTVTFRVVLTTTGRAGLVIAAIELFHDTMAIPDSVSIRYLILVVAEVVNKCERNEQKSRPPSQSITVGNRFFIATRN